jgi:hypothetical protein
MGPELLLLGALAKKIVDFLRQLRGKDTSAVVTQLVAWLSGMAVVFLAANVDFAGAIEVANMSLDQMSLWTQSILGLVVGSVGSVAKDVLKAVDNTQTEASPELIPGTSAPARDVR